jgi:hypothetical protein
VFLQANCKTRMAVPGYERRWDNACPISECVEEHAEMEKVTRLVDGMFSSS